MSLLRRLGTSLRLALWTGLLLLAGGVGLTLLPEAMRWLAAALLALLFVASLAWWRSAVAAAILDLEGRVPVGAWCAVAWAGGRLEGRVLSRTFSTTRLEDPRGLVHELPNHLFLDAAVTPRVRENDPVATELLVPIPAAVDPAAMLRAARELAALSPHASPRRRPEVYLEPAEVGFTLRVRGWIARPELAEAFRSQLLLELGSSELGAIARAEGGSDRA